MGQRAIQATQPDSEWEAEVLGGLLHRIGGEVTVGGSTVGKGPVAVEREDGPLAGSRWGVAGIQGGQGGWAGKGPLRRGGGSKCYRHGGMRGMSIGYR